MTPLDEQRLARAAEAIYREFENRPKVARLQMNGVMADELARAAITAYLGETHVVVPKEALSYARRMSNFCFNGKQLDRFDEKTRAFMDQMQSGFDRALNFSTRRGQSSIGSTPKIRRSTTNDCPKAPADSGKPWSAATSHHPGVPGNE